MKLFKAIVTNKVFSIITNTIIIISILFLIIEKLINITTMTYEIISIIDICIMVFFLLDFLLRFLAFGWRYVVFDYGWIDFLAALPIINSALKGLRFSKYFRLARILRAFRLIRSIRILKLYTYTLKAHSKIKQRLFLPVSSTILIILITSSAFLTFFWDSRLAMYDAQIEQCIINDAFRYYPDEEKIYSTLDKHPRVITVLEGSYSESVFLELSDKFIRKSDIFVERIGDYSVLFSRKTSRRIIDIFEGTTILILFIITVIILLVISIQIDKLVLIPIERIRSRLQYPRNFSYDNYRDEMDFLERAVKDKITDKDT